MMVRGWSGGREREKRGGQKEERERQKRTCFVLST